MLILHINHQTTLSELLLNQELSVLYGDAQCQVWGTIIPICSPYAHRKYDKKFGTPAIV